MFSSTNMQSTHFIHTFCKQLKASSLSESCDSAPLSTKSVYEPSDEKSDMASIYYKPEPKINFESSKKVSAVVNSYHQ